MLEAVPLEQMAEKLWLRNKLSMTVWGPITDGWNSSDVPNVLNIEGSLLSPFVLKNHSRIFNTDWKNVDGVRHRDNCLMSSGAAAHWGEPRGSASLWSVVEESADHAGTMMEGLEMPLCSFRHSLVSTCNTRGSTIPAESKPCRTQKQFFFFLQDLSNQPQGSLENWC